MIWPLYYESILVDHTTTYASKLLVGDEVFWRDEWVSLTSVIVGENHVRVTSGPTWSYTYYVHSIVAVR